MSCRVASTTGLVALTAVLWSRPAYAYIDWGTASMLFQALIGGLLAGLFTLKMYGGRLKAFFRSRRRGRDQDDE